MKASPAYCELMQQYFNSGYYYDIVRMITANDTGFLLEQLGVAESSNMRMAALVWQISMYTFQLQLPFSEDVIRHINTNLTWLKEQHSILLAKEISESSRPSRGSSFRIVWFVLVTLLFIARVCSRMERDNSRASINRHQYNPKPIPGGTLRIDTILIRARRDAAKAEAARRAIPALPLNEIQPEPSVILDSVSKMNRRITGE